MMKKVLFTASTCSHIRNFHLSYLRALKERGYDTWVAAAGEGGVPGVDHLVALPFSKSFFSPSNLKAMWQTRKLLRRERFSLVVTHTALAAAVTRAALCLFPHRPRVINVCHGYLFYESDGIGKWKYLLPEKLLAGVTDTLLVMNEEDALIAKKHRLAKTEPIFIPGMGVDMSPFGRLRDAERRVKRESMGYGEDDVVFVYAAEFSRRKNQSFLLRAFAKALPTHPRAKLLLPGDGALLRSCQQLAKSLGIESAVSFPGYVAAMAGVYGSADVAVSTSHSEGLPFNLMEAMSSSLPVLATRAKGHVELVQDGVTGILCDEGEEERFAQGIGRLCEDALLRQRMGEAGRERVQPFSIENVFSILMNLYDPETGEEELP